MNIKGMILRAKELAEEQYSRYCSEEEPDINDYVHVYSEKTGQDVINPWLDSSSRKELSSEEAVKEWGVSLFLEFVMKTSDVARQEEGPVMKEYYMVTFQHAENVFCANLAHAGSKEDVDAYYSKYAWHNTRPCNKEEYAEAIKKMMPVIEIPKAGNTASFFSLDNINDIIEIFEDFLKEHNVRIPDSDMEMEKDGASPDENEARIYGMVYGELQETLLGYFEKLSESGTVPRVVNSWDAEIETWPEMNGRSVK